MNLSYKKYRKIQRFSLHVPILYFTDKQHFTNDVHINQSLSISLLTLFCLFQNKPAPLSKIQKQKEMDTIKKLGSLMLILTISLPCFAKKKGFSLTVTYGPWPGKNLNFAVIKE